MTDNKEKKSSKVKLYALIVAVGIVFAALSPFSFIPYGFHSTYINLEMPRETPAPIRAIYYSSALLSQVRVSAMMTYMEIYEKLFLQARPYKEPETFGVFVVGPNKDSAIWQNKISVYYDWDNNGFAESSAWPGERVKVLAIEPEVGNFVLVTAEEKSGFKRIRDMDANNDGRIDNRDPDFSKLRIWNAVKSTKIKPENVDDIQSFYKAIDISGDQIRMIVSDEKPGASVLENRVDFAILKRQVINSVYIKPYVLNGEVLFLPTLRGYGLLPDLHIAMSLDDILLHDVRNIASCNLINVFSNPDATQKMMDDILFRWAKVDGIDKNSRGPFIDARKLHFLESLMGQEFFQIKKWHNPRPYAAEALESAWQDSVRGFSSRLIMQSCGRPLFKGVLYNPVTDELRVGEVNQEGVSSFLQAIKRLPPEQQKVAVANLKLFMSDVSRSMQPMDRMFMSFF